MFMRCRSLYAFKTHQSIAPGCTELRMTSAGQTLKNDIKRRCNQTLYIRPISVFAACFFPLASNRCPPAKPFSICSVFCLIECAVGQKNRIATKRTNKMNIISYKWPIACHAKRKMDSVRSHTICVHCIPFRSAHFY